MGRRVVAREQEPEPLPPQDEPDMDTGEVADEEASTELVALTDNVGEQSVEINVEGLIAELEAESRQHGGPVRAPCRRRLDDLLEERRMARELEDLEDFQV